MYTPHDVRKHIVILILFDFFQKKFYFIFLRPAVFQGGIYTPPTVDVRRHAYVLNSKLITIIILTVKQFLLNSNYTSDDNIYSVPQQCIFDLQQNISGCRAQYYTTIKV